MLSYIYRLVNEFETRHGIPPNLLYLNDEHVDRLKQGFCEEYQLHDIMNLLQMDLIIDGEVMHPHAAWTHTALKRAV